MLQLQVHVGEEGLDDDARGDVQPQALAREPDLNLQPADPTGPEHRGPAPEHREPVDVYRRPPAGNRDGVREQLLQHLEDEVAALGPTLQLLGGCLGEAEQRVERLTDRAAEGVEDLRADRRLALRQGDGAPGAAPRGDDKPGIQPFLRQPGRHLHAGERPESHPLAARADGLEQRRGPGGDEDELRPDRRLLQRLEQDVRGFLSERICGREDDDPVPRGVTLQVERVDDLTGLGSRDDGRRTLGVGRDDDDVRMGTREDPPALFAHPARTIMGSEAVDLHREPHRVAEFPDAFRPLEDKTMVQPPISRSAGEAAPKLVVPEEGFHAGGITGIMRLVRVRTGIAAMAPWREPVGALRVLGEPLAGRQERVARACGLTFSGEADGADGEADVLSWDDDLDLSVLTLRRFLKERREGRLALVERPARALTTSGPSLDPEPLGPGGSRMFGLRLGRSDDAVVLQPRGIPGNVRLPLGRTLETYATGQTATTIRHWVHLLRANLAALFPAILDQTLLAPWRPAWAWLRHGGRAAGSAVGAGSRIHPTARIEGCVLGRDVQIGAYSVLRGCVVGDGVIVEDHATARLSYLAHESHLANFAMFNLSVLGARSSAGHIGAQASILGDDAFLSTFATLQDLALVGDVRVRADTLPGAPILPSGTPFLGSALGHRVRIGSGISVAPGRAIGNDTTLVSDDVVRAPLGSGAWGRAGGGWRAL